MKSKTSIITLACVAGVFSPGCDRTSDTTDAGPTRARTLRVVAVNEPLAYFARRIGGDQVDAFCPAPTNTDPAYWEPGDGDLAAVQQADLILLNVAGYARWVATASLPESRMIDTSAAFTDRLIALGEGTIHSHGPEGAHEHGGMAFTTWLDFDLARHQAEAVHAALTRMPGTRRAELDAGRNALSDDLRALDRGFAGWGRSLGGAPLLGSHPVYQYFARAYGLNLRSVHWEPDTRPAEEEWKKLATLLESHSAKLMLWEKSRCLRPPNAWTVLGSSGWSSPPAALPCQRATFYQ